MQIEVNGAHREIASNATVSDLIRELELTDQRIAIEINEELVPRSTFTDHLLNENDRVEIVHAIGGG